MSSARDNPQTIAGVGVVAIGRNEGARLRRCLESVLNLVSTVVYVDSGSTDDSVNLARTLGAHVMQLDLSTPFTAARSRNAGVQRLLEIMPEAEFVQLVDSDCEIVSGWIRRAMEEFADAGSEQLAVVCGRRRERDRQASVYNRLADMEWDTTVGDAEACGGDALMRIAAFRAVGGFDETLIAGEEPELCWRLRRAGWRIRRIASDMTLHDANLMQFGQWWKRNVRSGHAYAEGHAMHGRVDGYCAHAVQSAVQWAVLVPALALGLAWWTWGASLLLLGAYAILWARVRAYRMNQHHDSSTDAARYASYCVVGKFAEAQGIAKYWWNRARGSRARLIEYKTAASAAESAGA